MPVLAPITWGIDGFPILTTNSGGGWGASYPMPLSASSVPSWTGTDSFSGTSLGPAWEWNHNPDTTKFSVSNGLTLSTTTVTTDLCKARNTLTHRVHGPNPVATIAIDFSNMRDGDRCGLAAFRDQSVYIGIQRSGSTYNIVMVSDITQSQTDWSTTSTGTTKAIKSVSKGNIWLRGNMDARPNGTKLVSFSYSTDGNTFTALGNSYTLNTAWQYFMGYRWAIFNHATISLGGSTKVSSFTQS